MTVLNTFDPNTTEETFKRLEKITFILLSELTNVAKAMAKFTIPI